LATQKIHFFTGKGGVGKSLLAASYACALSDRLAENTDLGPVLLTELTERSFYKNFLNLDSIAYQPIHVPQISKNLSVSQWSTTDCLKEYALYLLKIQSLYKLFFENPVSKSLINVAPGLQELAILGKASAVARKHGPAMPYSEVVIDSFASGHFMNLFRAPKAMSEVISFGSMGEQSRGIDQWLRNPELCHVHIVALPEELPITETIELYQKLNAEFGIRPTVYLNKVFRLSDQDLKSLTDSNQAYFNEITMNEKISIDKLADAGISFQKISFVPETDSLKLIQHIAKEITIEISQ
jgi:anion-transporting  ArsA/GET3 family ATPase